MSYHANTTAAPMNNPMTLPTLSRDAAPLAVGAGGTEEPLPAREEAADVVVASVLAPELVSEAWTLEALARVDETSLEAAAVMLESPLGAAELADEISLARELAMEAAMLDSAAVALEMRLEASTATDEATELATELTTAEAELALLARELAIEDELAGAGDVAGAELAGGV